jgi:hypothetical protein
MMKYRPKSFWNMLKPAKGTNQDIPTAAFADINKKIFFDKNIDEEGY